MTFDGIMTRALLAELKEKILPASVKKINQIGKNQITIQVYSGGKNLLLYISASPSDGRFHISEKKYKNPDTAPNLVMFLRKQIGRARLISIEQEGLDRTVKFTFSAINELGDQVERFLILELMGRHSNLILLDENNKVLEALRRVSFDMSRVRQIYPGASFQIFPSDKADILNEDIDIEQLIALSKEKNPDNYMNLACRRLFYSNITGFSPLVSDHILAKAGLDMDIKISDLTGSDIKKLNSLLKDLIHLIRTGDFSPVGYSEKNQAYPFSLAQFGEPDFVNSSMSLILDNIIPDQKSEDAFNRQKRKYLKALAKGLDKKLNKLKILEEDFAACLERNEIKEEADLLAANAHLVKRGAKDITVKDFFNNNKERLIKLDEKKNGHENMDALYKKFAKLNRAYKLLKSSIPELKKEILYYEQIRVMLDKSGSLEDLAEIRPELEKEALIKKERKGQNKKAQKSSAPLKFESPNGFIILVGKNNYQNDRLTLKIAKADDYFLHVKKVAGSHVILKTEGKEVPMEDIEAAAWLAASYSSASDNLYQDVDYCLKKNVYKAKGAKPGMVYYNDYKSIYVNMKAEANIKKLS